MSSTNPLPPSGPLLFDEGRLAPAQMWALALLISLFLVVAGFFTSVIFFLIGTLSLLAIIGAWGHEIYNRIQLFETELRVGRRSIAIADLDPGFSVRRASDVIDEEPLNHIAVGTGLGKLGNQVAHLGGRWESGFLGNIPLTAVRLTDTQQLLLIRVKDSNSFAPHLRGILSNYGAPQDSLGALTPQERPRETAVTIFIGIAEFVLGIIAVVAFTDWFL